MDPTEPGHAAALHNRARLLAEVGRRTEALTFARRYLALDPDSPWARQLRTDLQPD